MKRLWQNLSARLTSPLLIALLLGAGFMAFVAWDQSHWWRVKEDYGFGWLVPAFVAFVVYDRWEKIAATVGACAAPGSPRASGVVGKLQTIAVVAVMILGVLFFLLGAFYRAGAGTSQPGTLALTLGMIGIVLPLIYFNAPPTPAPTVAGFGRDPRLKLAALFLFPALVWLVSAPLVSAIDQQLRLFLLRKVVTVVSVVFEVLGLPLEQQGNVLVLPSGGTVGVEDACSGIRSLTGCLFAGSFLAAVFLQRWWQKIALVVAAMILAFVTNLARGLFLTSWAYRYGADSISGEVHDIAGYAVLGLTVVGLLLLLPIFNLRIRAAEDVPGSEIDLPPAKKDE
ncbi:exosortase/archaeosortase family protein [Horticoccus luteus]|uniref:Exosortase/archaeosortase family protein n=1 Tax=Horticoccus luteus TaxID=2862869 RepID=A0A8F9XMI2_9BACT|nr:exosortase/archaeosortase family protein [Horticoccus luteus]QYM80064.1 exosortase/archaeosortase family protein [Horticoccus luteus]